MRKNEKKFITVGNNQIIHKSGIFNSTNIDEVLIVSDTHFNHYPKTWEWPERSGAWEMDMISNWNDKTDRYDTVLHLGDFAFGNKEMVKNSRSHLNGYIFMIKGNHDKHGMKWYQDVGINMIKKPFFIELNDMIVIFSHRPVFGLDGSEYLNIHGHIHEKFYFMNKNYVNVSVEQTGFAPVKFKDLIQNWRLHNTKNEI
jgi:calcineurin-like phosphoesterase family protein